MGCCYAYGYGGTGMKGAVKAGGIAGGLTGYGMSENTNPYSLALDTATGAALGLGLVQHYMGLVRLRPIHRFRNSQRLHCR